MSPPTPHSIEHLGPTRRYLWNYDFLELMGRRWRLGDVRKALDVGCGVGHWSAVVSSLLPPSAQLIGVDREPQWIQIAASVAAQTGKTSSFVVGQAESLDFVDNSFDLVTCQTLLIHVKDPAVVLREMKRVLAPGGLIAIVEPNNLLQAFPRTRLQEPRDIERTLDQVRFALTCSLGRDRLGEGNVAIGEQVPGLLAELGFEALEVQQSDRPVPFYPPYETEEQRLLTMSAGDADDTSEAFRFWTWTRSEAEQYFLAGGGDANQFAALWAQLQDSSRTEQAQIQAGTFNQAGGRVLYLVSARKGRRS